VHTEQYFGMLHGCGEESGKVDGAGQRLYNNPSSSTRPSTPTSEPAELCLRFETALKYPVNYRREARALNGVADYTLWYDNNESMGTNLVIQYLRQKKNTSRLVNQLHN
jgi:hypothetical protein